MSNLDRRLGPYRVGEEPEQLVVTVTDADGVAINVTSATVTMKYSRDGGATTTGAGTGAVVSGTGGQIGYTWASADLATAGDMTVWLTYTLSGRDYLAEEFYLRVIPGPWAS